ncbi:hypothetical protein COCMIDRAFT_33144 [Bipolaris oryzae ATCC 44560]|uniref:Uncharacterized protein n=1 Tax=Bipolaris oryzae ATCC 44560 TaxID=930090 RepID=W6ZCH1_COCMI|nr:uncharacterized protein COCMIDRAFT_33144 [Bipolaris oryzae ATCC 44560]EUC49507.1 hypothetical protein COCMIDRAFT_33144 [Bipolaris oryzae ATCC 44560]
MSRQWFTEFMNDIYPDTNTDATYFTPRVALPGIALLKEYALYIARSRVGRIADKLSVNSVQHHMGKLISIIQRSCNHLPTDIRTKMHPKTVAHTEDVTRVLLNLYKPQYLITFSNMRTVLRLT